MENFLEFVLEKIGGEPAQLGAVFGERLTYQEELMLGKLDHEIGIRVERVLDAALAGANAENNGQILLDLSQRERVMFLTAVRKEIHILIEKRGSLKPWREGLN